MSEEKCFFQHNLAHAFTYEPIILLFEILQREILMNFSCQFITGEDTFQGRLEVTIILHRRTSNNAN